MKRQIALILLLTMLCTLLCPAAFAATQEDPNGNAVEVSEKAPTESEETPVESEKTPAKEELDKKTAADSSLEKYRSTLSDAAKKASATLKGKTYSYEQLQKGLPEGLTEEERSELLEQCRTQMADSCADAFIELITALRELIKEMDVSFNGQMQDDSWVSQDNLQIFYQVVKEFASDPRFSGSVIPGESRYITAEEFLDEFTAIVKEASPLAAEALEDLKDTDSIVINNTESESASGEITYLNSDEQPALLELNLGTTNDNFDEFAALLGAYAGVYANDGTENLQDVDWWEDWEAAYGTCLMALLTAYYDSVLSDADAAILANNTVTSLKNELVSCCMASEWEQYLNSDAPLTKEGLIEKYSSLCEAYGVEGAGCDGILNLDLIEEVTEPDTQPQWIRALSAFFALQVFNEAMKDPDDATEMFEELCEELNDVDALKDAGFVSYTDENGVRKTLEKAAENYEVLHEYASVVSEETSAEPEETPTVSEEMPAEPEETPAVPEISKEDFLARCQELAEQAENGEEKQVLAIYDSLKEKLKELEDQISHIQAQGGEISDEVSSNCAACREAFLDAAYALTQGKLREKLKDHISEEEFAYLEQFPPMSEERRAKTLAVDSALEEYETTLNDAVKNASATLKGKTYTYEQLQEGLPEGLTEEEQSELLEQFRSQVIDSCADAFIQVITARRELAKEVGVTSYDQLLYAIHDRKVSQEDLQTFYQIVKECITDPRFSGTGIPERNQDFTTEEFLDEFTAIVEEASPLAAKALEYLKDTDSIVIENAQSDSGLSSMAYFYSGDQQGLLNLNLVNTTASFQIFARLLGAFTGLYASYETDGFCVSGLDEDRTQVCGACLSALLTGYYDSVLSDTDAAILANNTVTRLINELKIYCMMSEMEQYLYSDAPLTKEGLIDKYNSLCESYGMKGSDYLSIFSYEIMQPLSSDNKTMRAGAPSAFYALQVFNKVMKNSDKATEMFEELCTSMNDEEALKEVGFVYFADADGVRETLQEAAENYEVLHGYASMMSALRDNGVELELDGDLSEILQIMKQVKPLIEQLPELLTKLQEAA